MPLPAMPDAVLQQLALCSMVQPEEKPRMWIQESPSANQAGQLIVVRNEDGGEPYKGRLEKSDESTSRVLLWDVVTDEDVTIPLTPGTEWCLATNYVASE
jgi:hypothetical protein